MNKIQVLDTVTIDKIAAGEVIERPASVVKELVENAIDAGATAVVVEIQEGGTSLIRIADNGCGIEKEEVPNAFLRHSTSKIRSVDDLVHIGSLGFRGEALSSIAAVSQVELITKTKEQTFGTRYRINGGKEVDLEDTGARDGTTFLIQQLFYNVPARRKFLKTPMTEASHVGDLMTRLALSHPEISFQFINNGQSRLHSSGNGKLRDVIYHVYGRDIASNLLKVNASAEDTGIKITGFLGKPVISRGNRNFENYFINGRYVKNPIVSKAIEDAYKDFSMQHKYPFVVLHMEIDGENVDVNVHPAKMELRFHNQQEVYNRVYEAVNQGLHAEELIPHVELAPAVSVADGPGDKGLPFEGLERISRASGADSRRQTPDRTALPPSSGNSRQAESIRAGLERSAGLDRSAGLERSAGLDRSGDLDRNAGLNRSADLKRSAGLDNSAGLESGAGLDDSAGSERTAKAKEKAPLPPAAERDLDYFMEKMKERVEAYHSQRSSAEVPEKGGIYKPKLQADRIRETVEYAKKEPKQLDLFEEKLLTREAKNEYHLIGQVFDTYWLVEFRDNLYIIDQHAAHERILYERTLKSMKTREFTSQMISPPIILNLSMQEAELLNQYMDQFTRIGFEFEEFGQESVAVRAVPDNLFSIARKELLLQMLDGLSEEVSRNLAPELIDEKVASMSCKAAVKGNMKLSAAEVDALIGELLTLENPYHCPHGRPTIIAMSRRELEKKFKRIV
ncbi:DNA mismatch repair protein MutL [Lachnospiraceae bacterium]|nr:DNA mismatch repair protein MutL [Lachnospiraceae bacterium]